MDNPKTPRQDKRKASDTELNDSRRPAPVRPIIGSSVEQLNRQFNETMSGSLSSSNPGLSFSTIGGAAAQQSMGNSISGSNPGPSFSTVGGFSQQSQQDGYNSISTSNHGPSFFASSLSSASSFNTVDLNDVEMTEWPTTIPSIGPKASDDHLESNRQSKPQPTLFNLLLDHEDIMYEVCRWLPAADLVHFYALSKVFHRTINLRLTTLILGNAQTRMPESAEVFHFKVYKSLCMMDAAQNPSYDKAGMIRDVPTLRWLRFLEFREGTVTSILEQLALKGLRLPRGVSKVMKKIWFLMDLPDTRRRIGCVHNPRLWSDMDLFLACMFFLKLDMACADPVLNEAERRVRMLLMAQRTLSVTDRVLKREMMRNQYEMLQMWVLWNLNLRLVIPAAMPRDEIPRTIFGVPLVDVASLRSENWTPGNRHLVRPDSLIMKESIRRGLRFQDKLIDMLLWGNIHPTTREDVRPKNWKGEVQIVFDDETEDQTEKDIAIHISKEGTQFTWDGDYYDTT